MEKEINYEAQYWKNEYEQLRRKKNKEIEIMRNNQVLFFDKTYKLLSLLGMKPREVSEIYGNRAN